MRPVGSTFLNKEFSILVPHNPPGRVCDGENIADPTIRLPLEGSRAGSLFVPGEKRAFRTLPLFKSIYPEAAG
ncbi:hypothetical protein D4R75_14230 [bacterium]|nr:MAG: hypothetical protein D4R75_14230 [bacterium]